MRKFDKFEIVYNSKKFCCNRVKVLHNSTLKACFKAKANLMAKGYKIIELRVNNMNIDDYINYYGLEEL